MIQKVKEENPILNHFKGMSPLPDVGDFIFLFIIWLSLFLLPDLFFQDGSTGWHLVTGNYILENLKIPYTDLISSTYPDKDWVAYEWLFDVAIAALVKLGGTNLLAVALSTTLGFLFLAIYDKCRRNGCGIAVSSFLVMVAILVSAIHWLARPHILTYIFVLIFLFGLDRFYKNNIRTGTLFMLLLPTMLVWTYCHPSFGMGCIVTLIYFMVTFFQIFLSRDESTRQGARKKSITLFILMASCTLLTFVNPYGVNLHLYIIEYLQGQEILKSTNEFMSPVFHGGLHETCLEILFLAFVAGLARKTKTLDTPTLLVCLAFAHAALAGVRSMPMFAIIATPAIAYLWASPEDEEENGELESQKQTETETEEEEKEESNPETDPSGPIDRIVTTLKNFEEQEALSKMHLVPVLTTVVLIVASLNGGTLFGNKIVNSGFDPNQLPVETINYIQENKLMDKTGLNLDNWGGYLRYKLNHRVFIDDRADFYGYDFYRDYSVMMATGNKWKELLDKYKIQWVLFPKESKLANALRQQRDWKEVASDKASALFVKI